MNRGFLSPKIAKKVANVPSVDVGVLAARMKRLKGDEVEDAGVTQPRQAMRVVNPQSTSRPEGINDHVSTSGATTQPSMIDKQVKPVSLGDSSTDSVGISGVTVDTSVGDVAQGADVGIKVNDKVDLDDTVQPSVVETQPDVEQLIANAHKHFDDAMKKLDSDIANMASSSLNTSGGSNANNVTSPNTSFSEAMKTQKYTSVEEVFKASSDKVPNTYNVGDSSNGGGSNKVLI